MCPTKQQSPTILVHGDQAEPTKAQPIVIMIMSKVYTVSGQITLATVFSIAMEQYGPTKELYQYLPAPSFGYRPGTTKSRKDNKNKTETVMLQSDEGEGLMEIHVTLIFRLFI